jgi:hypothetical protein
METMSEASPPTRRLVTQNLIVSAVMAERSGGASAWQQIEDMAALIDAYCLFDEIHVLGRERNVLGYLKSPIAELLSAQVHVDEVSDKLLPRVRTTAAAHYKTFYGNREIDLDIFMDADFSELNPLARDFLVHASYGGDYDTSRRYDYYDTPLRDAYDAERNEGRGPQSFFQRAFLYLAYADVMRMPFTPDGRRARILAEIIRPEDALAAQLANILRTQYAEGLKNFQNIRKRVSPMAAVVFDRANGDRRKVAAEMQRLRDELAGLRDRIRHDEYKMWFGSFRDAQRAERKWQLAFAELGQSYGAEPDILTVHRALNFAENIAHVVDEPRKAKSWATSLLSLPAESIRRLLSRRPLVEIHRLRNQIPAGGRLDKAVIRLFDPY